MIKHTKSWYRKGLQFECVGCGKCCGGEPGGYVWVNEEEIKKLADHMGLTIADFAIQYLKKVDDHYSLLIHPNGDCVFLKDGGCAVYPARPFQCSSFPFWPHIVISRKKWDERAAKCSGINHGRLHPFSAITKTIIKFRKHYEE
jgi:uncharacterized protein